MSESTDNYLKAIYSLSQKTGTDVSTNALAEKMQTKASSVTDMLSKLHEKGFVKYTKYRGATLTTKGEKSAIEIVRKHRLWEVFLVGKLKFGWDEVHEIAEQLEHIDSPELTNRLDEFLEFPEYDPHGDPIPNSRGQIPKLQKSYLLNELQENDGGYITAVSDSSSEFLRHLEKINLKIGTEIQVRQKFSFDNSVEILVKGKKVTLSQIAANNILVHKI